MKGQIVIFAGLISTACLAQVVHSGSGGYGADSRYTTAYNINSQVIFSGKVVGLSTYRPASGMGKAESILVKNAKGTFEVDLGPEWYVKNQVAHVYMGENVRVIGSQVTMGGNRVLAKQIINTDNNHVLALRDLSGYPYWVAARSASGANSATPPANAVGGTVQSMQTVMINGVPYQSYVIKTADGNVNVVTAPQWYMQNQDFSIPVGTYIQAVGGPGPINLGNGTILANTLYSGGTTILLNPSGFPVWNPYGPHITQ